MKDKFKIKGTVRFTLKNKSGKVIKEYVKENLITNTGLATIAKALLQAGGDTSIALGTIYIGVGDNSVAVPAPSVTDMTLANELANVAVPRKAINYWRINNYSAIFQTDWMPTEGNSTPPNKLADAGLFWNGATANRNTGDLVSRVLMIPTLAKDGNKTLTITWIYTFGRI